MGGQADKDEGGDMRRQQESVSSSFRVNKIPNLQCAKIYFLFHGSSSLSFITRYMEENIVQDFYSPPSCSLSAAVSSIVSFLTSPSASIGNS